MVEKMSKFS